MSDDLIGKWELSRRRVLGGAAGLGLAGLPGGAFGQAAGPWSVAPKSKVDRLNFVVWTYGDIYTRIAKQFEADWGVKVDSTISSFNDHPTKLATMYAAGEKIDVSQSSPFSFPNFVNQGLVEPLDDLPGAADYAKDFTPFTKQVAMVERQDDGPALLRDGVGVELLRGHAGEAEDRQAVHDLRRVHRALRQGQEGRRLALSRPVDRRRRPRAAAGHLVPDDLEPRRHVLRQAGQPHAGRRLGRPRDAEMVGQHLREGPRHRRSRIAQGAVHQRRQGLRRRQEPLSRAEPSLRPQHLQRSGAVADRRQGQGRWARRATARRSASPMSISCRRPTATRNGRGSCCSISAARPRTATTRRPSAWPRMPCWARATPR